jgi:hypothetical protein
MVTFGSEKKVWWLCENGHEWMAVIGQRATSRFNKCPHCKKFYSALELRVFAELESLIGAVWHDTSFGVEVDVYLPSLKLAIEVDGSHWHRDKHDKDIAKNEILYAAGLRVMRVREMPLPLLSKIDIGCSHKEPHVVVLHRLAKKLMHVFELDLTSYITSDDFANDSKYCELISKLCFPSNSVSKISQKIVQEWHPTKNGALKPENISYASHKPIWWLCECGNEWVASPSNRSRRNKLGCSICEFKSREKVDEKDILECLQSGNSYNQIAHELGVSHSYVSKKASEMRKNGFVTKRKTGTKPNGAVLL